MEINLNEFKALKVSFKDKICRIQFNRPESKNTIDSQTVIELTKILNYCEDKMNIVVLEGNDEVFCFGADFKQESSSDSKKREPGVLYDLWKKLACGSFVSIAYVKGRANAGGMGFVAASDIVIAGENAMFSLSELLFGLYPAMVMPFLIRKIGFQKAKYMALTTKPVNVQTAFEWGIVEAFGPKSDMILGQHLARLTKIPKSAVVAYKNYMNKLDLSIENLESVAVSENLKMFSDKENMERISQFTNTGQIL
ncbi:MAG: enoyl-CoA hydratase/isomerase [Ruminococcus bromii]|nr:enoyl-CoA hydratase/isomerase [Ruminococcus bromii]MEE3498467.1 enoyl-CoA hydratase/isomerase [Ruminococcus bromii]